MRTLHLIAVSAAVASSLLAPSRAVAQTLTSESATDAAVAAQLESRIIDATNRDRYIVTRRHKAEQPPYDTFGSAHPSVWGPWGGNYGLGWGGLSGWSASGPLYQQQAVIARMTVDLKHASDWRATIRGPWMYRSARIVSTHRVAARHSRARMAGR
jgi:hypothetical protein